MEKKIKENTPSQIDANDLPFKRKQDAEKPEFIDDHVPGNHGSMEQDEKNERTPIQDNERWKSH